MATTPVLLPGKSRGQRRLVGYNSRGRKRVGHDLATEQEQQLSNNRIGLREESTTQSHTAFQSQRRDSDSVHQIPNSIPLSKPVSEETWELGSERNQPPKVTRLCRAKEGIQTQFIRFQTPFLSKSLCPKRHGQTGFVGILAPPSAWTVDQGQSTPPGPC